MVVVVVVVVVLTCGYDDVSLHAATQSSTFFKGCVFSKRTRVYRHHVRWWWWWCGPVCMTHVYP